MRFEPSLRPPGILFISHEAQRSGAALLLLSLMQWLRSATELRVFTLLCQGGTERDKFAALGPVFDAPQQEATLWWTPPAVEFRAQRLRRSLTMHRILRDLDRERVDLIYANTMTTDVARAAVALRPLGVPIITHVHELDYWIRNHVDRDELEALKASSSRYIAVSRAVAQNLSGAERIPADRVTIVNGWTAASERNVARDIPLPVGVPAEALIIAGCGAVGRYKGCDLFVQLAGAVKRLVPQLPVHFVWVGGPKRGADYRWIEHDIAKSGLQSSVHFIGETDRPLDILARSTVFVLTSRQDSFPLVLLEASALGVPTVTFVGAGGAEEFVGIGAAVGVPYLDIAAMAERVVELLRSPRMREDVAQRAGRRIMERHTIDYAGPRILEVIRQELGRVTGAPTVKMERCAASISEQGREEASMRADAREGPPGHGSR